LLCNQHRRLPVSAGEWRRINLGQTIQLVMCFQKFIIPKPTTWVRHVKRGKIPITRSNFFCSAINTGGW
jgi:hypothetical protein